MIRHSTAAARQALAQIFRIVSALRLNIKVKITQPAGKKKREVVEHFQPLYDKSAVYRELKKLVNAGQVLECIGIVTAVCEVRNGAK